jgi:hypothetical protein
MGAAAILVHAPPARAQVFSEELRVRGFWPDVALSAGGGIGLGDSLGTNVMARARVGALYAYEPLIVNLGITGEVGALARRGMGLELELNHFGGPFLQAGFERVAGDDWMSHVMLGFAEFGVEWQHRIDPGLPAANNALMFVLRLPVGIWWFLLVKDAEQDAAQKRARGED